MFHPLEFFSKGKLKIDFLPAGRFQEESSELLGSEKMKKLMRAVQFKYDYILLDTPPLSSLVDAFVLGKMGKKCYSGYSAEYYQERKFILGDQRI